MPQTPDDFNAPKQSAIVTAIRGAAHSYEWRELTLSEQAQVVADAYAELEALRDENKRLREMLKRCEWIDGGASIGGLYCPICANFGKNGHAPDCELAKLLKEGK